MREENSTRNIKIFSDWKEVVGQDRYAEKIEGRATTDFLSIKVPYATYANLGRKYGVSNTRIRQIIRLYLCREKAALIRMKS